MSTPALERVSFSPQAVPTEPERQAAEREELLHRIGETVREAVATGQQAAFTLFDINGFAEINAAWGLLAGDALLRASADRLHDIAAFGVVIVATAGGGCLPPMHGRCLE